MNSCIYYAQELLKVLYPNTTIDSKLSEQAALAAVGQACDEVRKLHYLRSLSEGDVIPYGWITTFGKDFNTEVEIKQTGSHEFYCDLPASVIQVPNDRGIRRVWPSRCPERLVYPVTQGFKGMFATSKVKNLGGRMGYFPRKNRIYFLQDMSKYESVDMDLFASAQSLDEDAIFPADDSIMNDIMGRAVEIWGTQKQVPEDQLNDGISQ